MKRPVLITSAILICAIIVSVFLFAPHRYTSIVVIEARPYTNSLFSPQFIKSASEISPSICRVAVRQSAFQLAPSRRYADFTNCVSIYIKTQAGTPEEAQKAATDAAATISHSVLTNYGVSSAVALPAKPGRKWSMIADNLRPLLDRILHRTRS